MYLSVTKVAPKENYYLLLTFANGEQRRFDVKPYLDFGIFKELRDLDLFNSVRVCFDSIKWDNDADLDPEVLYERSERVNVLFSEA